MKRNLFVKSILLVLVAILTGCNSEENPENTISESEQLLLVRKALAKAPEQIAEEEDLPEWLSEFVNTMTMDDIRDVAAYQAKWEGEDIYYVFDSYASCLMCSTFKSDGDRIDWSKTDLWEFWESATDWKCIYRHKSKILDI
ncbi:MAG: hypothetical protein HDS38_06325 [Bacteroides sp.]|nr:hypothetical protein [Bacteroides sp.]MBD5263479.1 hypothetical protein [Bacteroides sp.]